MEKGKIIWLCGLEGIQAKDGARENAGQLTTKLSGEGVGLVYVANLEAYPESYPEVSGIWVVQVGSLGRNWDQGPPDDHTTPTYFQN